MTDNNQKAKKAPLIYAIVGVITLIIAVAGSTFAYYSATISSNLGEVQGEAGGGELPVLTVTPISTGATDKLIPIDMTTDMLTNAAKGYGNTGETFDASKACKDKNGYTVCQIYEVSVTNRSDVTMSYYIGLTELSGEKTPNVTAVTMKDSDGNPSNVIVSSATKIVEDTDGICTTNAVGLNGTTNKCYFMVVIENLNEAQTDNGVFNGTVTAVSTAGDEVKAQF